MDFLKGLSNSVLDRIFKHGYNSEQCHKKAAREREYIGIPLFDGKKAIRDGTPKKSSIRETDSSELSPQSTQRLSVGEKQFQLDHCVMRVVDIAGDKSQSRTSNSSADSEEMVATPYDENKDAPNITTVETDTQTSTTVKNDETISNTYDAYKTADKEDHHIVKPKESGGLETLDDTKADNRHDCVELEKRNDAVSCETLINTANQKNSCEPKPTTKCVNSKIGIAKIKQESVLYRIHDNSKSDKTANQASHVGTECVQMISTSANDISSVDENCTSVTENINDSTERLVIDETIDDLNEAPGHYESNNEAADQSPSKHGEVYIDIDYDENYTSVTDNSATSGMLQIQPTSLDQVSNENKQEQSDIQIATDMCSSFDSQGSSDSFLEEPVSFLNSDSDLRKSDEVFSDITSEASQQTDSNSNNTSDVKSKEVLVKQSQSDKSMLPQDTKHVKDVNSSTSDNGKSESKTKSENKVCKRGNDKLSPCESDCKQAKKSTSKSKISSEEKKKQIEKTEKHKKYQSSKHNRTAKKNEKPFVHKKKTKDNTIKDMSSDKSVKTKIVDDKKQALTGEINVDGNAPKSIQTPEKPQHEIMTKNSPVKNTAKEINNKRQISPTTTHITKKPHSDNSGISNKIKNSHEAIELDTNLKLSHYKLHGKEKIKETHQLDQPENGKRKICEEDEKSHSKKQCVSNVSTESDVKSPPAEGSDIKLDETNTRTKCAISSLDIAENGSTSNVENKNSSKRKPGQLIRDNEINEKISDNKEVIHISNPSKRRHSCDESKPSRKKTKLTSNKVDTKVVESKTGNIEKHKCDKNTAVKNKKPVKSKQPIQNDLNADTRQRIWDWLASTGETEVNQIKSSSAKEIINDFKIPKKDKETEKEKSETKKSPVNVTTVERISKRPIQEEGEMNQESAIKKAKYSNDDSLIIQQDKTDCNEKVISPITEKVIGKEKRKSPTPAIYNTNEENKKKSEPLYSQTGINKTRNKSETSNKSSTSMDLKDTLYIDDSEYHQYINYLGNDNDRGVHAEIKVLNEEQTVEDNIPSENNAELIGLSEAISEALSQSTYDESNEIDTTKISNAQDQKHQWYKCLKCEKAIFSCSEKLRKHKEVCISSAEEPDDISTIVNEKTKGGDQEAQFVNDKKVSMEQEKTLEETVTTNERPCSKSSPDKSKNDKSNRDIHEDRKKDKLESSIESNIKRLRRMSENEKADNVKGPTKNRDSDLILCRCCKKALFKSKGDLMIHLKNNCPFYKRKVNPPVNYSYRNRDRHYTYSKPSRFGKETYHRQFKNSEDRSKNTTKLSSVVSRVSPSKSNKTSDIPNPDDAVKHDHHTNRDHHGNPDNIANSDRHENRDRRADCNYDPNRNHHENRDRNANRDHYAITRDYRRPQPNRRMEMCRICRTAFFTNKYDLMKHVRECRQNAKVGVRKTDPRQNLIHLN